MEMLAWSTARWTGLGVANSREAWIGCGQSEYDGYRNSASPLQGGVEVDRNEKVRS